MPDIEIPLYARASFNAYAFIGWLTTCIDHQDLEIPTKPDEQAGLWLADLGDVGFGWRFDAACRRGWALLCEVEGGRIYAERFLLPRCGDFIRGCVLGEIRSR
jgi:hypothetical protein